MNMTTTSATPPDITSMSSLYALPATPAGKRIERWKVSSLTNECEIAKPLRWRDPRHALLQFDPFHESVPFEWIDRVFAVMALAPRHTFQLLSKRPERMRWYLSHAAVENIYARACRRDETLADRWRWPLPNAWLGTSVEDQPTAAERIPHLLATPAAVRFVSAEPLLGPVDLTRLECAIGGNSGQKNALTGDFWISGCGSISSQTLRGGKRLDWAIAGCESGPHARPMRVEWAESLKEQCRSAGVPFFMKQLSGPGGKAIKEIEKFPANLQIMEWPSCR